VIRRWNLLAALLATTSCWTAQNTPQVEPQQTVASDIPEDCVPATHSQVGDVELTTCSVARGSEAEWRAYLVQPSRADPLDEPNARALAIVGALAGTPLVFVKLTGVDGRESIQVWRRDGKPSLVGAFDGKTAALTIDDRGATIRACDSDDACATKSVRWVDGALVLDQSAQP
jgi:hypothetical protein